jgi:hypothetical protein
VKLKGNCPPGFQVPAPPSTTAMPVLCHFPQTEQVPKKRCPHCLKIIIIISGSKLTTPSRFRCSAATDSRLCLCPTQPCPPHVRVLVMVARSACLPCFRELGGAKPGVPSPGARNAKTWEHAAQNCCASEQGRALWANFVATAVSPKNVPGSYVWGAGKNLWSSQRRPHIGASKAARRVLKIAVLGHLAIIVPGYYKTVPSRQREFVALLGRKILHWGCLGLQGGCWGPVLSFSSCRLGHFLSSGDPRHWPFGFGVFIARQRSWHGGPLFPCRVAL